jgi:hypothetical protein
LLAKRCVIHHCSVSHDAFASKPAPTGEQLIGLLLFWRNPVSAKGGCDFKPQKAQNRALGSVLFMYGAQEKTRTSTTVRSPAPEAGVSTNFTTWAWR